MVKVSKINPCESAVPTVTSAIWHGAEMQAVSHTSVSINNDKVIIIPQYLLKIHSWCILLECVECANRVYYFPSNN